MPCVTKFTQQSHRHKSHLPHYNACVARPVGKKEVDSNPKAKAAKRAEWTRLRSVERPDGTIGAWDESRVAEWRDVRRQAARDNIKVHVGRIFDFVVEKNSELSDSDPKKKFKGRAVFEGSYVKDEAG